jgi:uncharacterized protein (DUF885 family)
MVDRNSVLFINCSNALHNLFLSEWDRTLREFPLFASELGEKQYNGRWPDLSPDGFQRRHSDDLRVLELLATIDPTILSEEDRLNAMLFRKKYETAVEEFRFRWWLLPLTAREGIQDANAVADAIVFEGGEDYEDWLSRLRLFPEYMEQTIGLMREGIRIGMVHPMTVMQRVPDQIRRQIVTGAEQSLFFRPFQVIPSSLPDAVRETLIKQAQDQIMTGVVPAYQCFLEFFEAEYLPACSKEIGVWRLPEGEELYRFFARKFTTTDLLPAKIHEIGLGEVARIRQEMEQIVDSLDFRGTFGEFLVDLRTNPSFYVGDANELIAAYRETCARIDAQLPRLFQRLPRVGYDIRPIPDNIAPDTTTAYYRPPSLGTTCKSRGPWRSTTCRPSAAMPQKASTPAMSRAGPCTLSHLVRSSAATRVRIPCLVGSHTRCGALFGSWSIPASTSSAGRETRP